MPDQSKVDIIIQGFDGLYVDKDAVAKFGQTWQHLVITPIFYDADDSRFHAFDLQTLI